MAKSNKSRYALLGMLALFPKRSGYDLKKLMGISTQYFWKETYSSIYPILGELENEGLIAQHVSEPQGARKRKVFSLTPEGQNVLKEWLNKSPEPEQLRNELLLKLFFGEIVAPTLNKKHLEDFLKRTKNKKEMYVRIKKQLIDEEQESQGLPFWLMTMEYGLKQLQSAIEWSEETIQQLSELEKKNLNVKET